MKSIFCFLFFRNLLKNSTWQELLCEQCTAPLQWRGLFFLKVNFMKKKIIKKFFDKKKTERKKIKFKKICLKKIQKSLKWFKIF